MAFDSWQALLAMGGHGLYVWSAYGVTLTVLAWLVAAPLLQRRRLLREIAASERRRAAAAHTSATTSLRG